MSEGIWRAWFDGATKETNPGLRGLGGLLLSPTGERTEVSLEVGHGTNNEAEYMALMAVLDAAIGAGVKSLRVHGDSQLVINQVNGAWLIKTRELALLCKTVRDLMEQIPKVQLSWVPRTENTEADLLSKRALGIVDKDSLDRSVWMKVSAIAKPFGISGAAIGKMMDTAGFRRNGKPTELAILRGIALRIPNGFGHDDFWHRQKLPQALRELNFLD